MIDNKFIETNYSLLFSFESIHLVKVTISKNNDCSIRVKRILTLCLLCARPVKFTILKMNDNVCSVKGTL